MPKRKPIPKTPLTVSKTYRLHPSIIEAIKRLAPKYGSRGRTLQVGTELLVRRTKPIKLPAELVKADCVGAATYKLVPRTIDLIEQLATSYGRHGDVLTACVEILRD